MQQNTPNLKPTISFIIPAFNEERYLDACLSSIAAEQIEAGCRAEIIVVNNGSTDRTREIAASYQNVKVVDEWRKGISYARQAGYQASQGDLIANIDADSMLPKGWVKRAVAYFAAHPDTVAMSGPCDYYDLDYFSNLGVAFYYRLAYGMYLINRFVLKAGSLIQGGNAIIRRSALERIGGYDPKFTFYGEDSDIARRLHKVGPVVFSLNMFFYTSGRRIAKEGLLTMAWKYPANYISTIFFKRAVTATAEDIRTFEPRPLARRMYALSFAAILLLLGVARARPPYVQAATKTIGRSEDRIEAKYKKYGSRFHMHRHHVSHNSPARLHQLTS